MNRRYETPIIKYAQQNNEKMNEEEASVVKRIDTVIKRNQINYTYEQKYKLGIMNEVEYFNWQLELAQEEEARRRAGDASVTDDELIELNSILNGEVDMTKHTFWEGEDGDRENIATDEYEEFLKANAIDVSNKTNTSFEELAALAQSEEDKALEDEVARIQAKFMPTQGNIDELFANNAINDDKDSEDD